MPSFLKESVTGSNRFVTGIAMLAALGGLLFGFDTGVISGAQLFIGHDLHSSTTAEQWFVGALLLGAVVGAAASGYLADAISRKWTTFAAGVIYVVAALWSGLAGSTAQLIIARAILGLAVGAASFVAPLYISEHVPPKLRGGTVSYNQLMITSGIFIAYLVDFFFKNVTNNWRWMLGLGALPGIALTIGMLIVPHTPRWLIQHGRDDEAKAVLRRTREGDIDDEYNEIRETIDQESASSWSTLLSGRLRPVLVVGLALALFQQFVGVNTVIYYSPTILKFTGLSADSSITQALSVGITNVVFTTVAILLLDRVGRRKLLLTGTVGLTVSLIVLGLFFKLASLQAHTPWLALVALVVFIASFAIGLGPVFWLMISEIFPQAERSKAMSICTLANWGSNFLISFYFLTFVGWIGRSATFWVYAAFGVAAVAFFAWRVPETKGRTLEEIERDLGAGGVRGKRSRDPKAAPAT